MKFFIDLARIIEETIFGDIQDRLSHRSGELNVDEKGAQFELGMISYALDLSYEKFSSKRERIESMDPITFCKLMKSIEDLSMYDLDAALRRFFGDRGLDQYKNQILRKEGIGLKALSHGKFDFAKLQDLKRNLKERTWEYWFNDISNFGGRDATAVMLDPITEEYVVSKGARARARLGYRFWKMLTAHFGKDITAIKYVHHGLKEFIGEANIFQGDTTYFFYSSMGAVNMIRKHLEALERVIRNMDKAFYTNPAYIPSLGDFERFSAFERDHELLKEEFRTFVEEAHSSPFGGRIGGQIGGSYDPKIADSESYIRMMKKQFTSQERMEKAQSIRRLTFLLAHNKVHKGAFLEDEKNFYEAHKNDRDRYARISQFYYNVRQPLGQTSREKIWSLLREWTNKNPLSGGDMLAPSRAGRIGYISNEPGKFDQSKFSGMLPQVLKRVMFFAKGDITHERLQELILKDPWMKSLFIGKEISVWAWSGDKEALLTGHLDLIFLIDGALYYFEYKPGDDHKPDSDKLSDHLFQSIPQASAGALALMS